jgi:hypothetical protein
LVKTKSISGKFKVGDRVITTKGRKTKKPGYGGVITKFSKWRVFPAAVVKKSDGSHRLFLIKNLKHKV